MNTTTMVWRDDVIFGIATPSGRVPVAGHALGVLAIYGQPGNWALTHLPTGYEIARIGEVTLESAKGVVERIAALGLDWEFFTPAEAPPATLEGMIKVLGAR